MRPSQAMGLFLRTWRVEWAELSRTQLARLLVRAGASRVTAHTVRAWELGQPPHDLVELDGLCECMKRHGLSTLEDGQFREIVFAACLDRQYDGLFEDEPLTSRADLDECAQVMASTLTRDPREASLPALIAAQHELDQSLSGALSGHISLAQRRRQVAARIIIGSALGWHYLGCARWAAAVRQLRTSEDLLRRFYGMQGLGPGLRVLDHRVWAIRAEAAAERSPRRVLRLRDELGQWESRWPGFGPIIHFTTLGCAMNSHQPSLCQALLDGAEPCLNVWRRLGLPGWAARDQLTMAEAYLADGDPQRAERVMEMARPELERSPANQIDVSYLEARLALAAGRCDEARRLVEPAVALAMARGAFEREQYGRGLLYLCEHIKGETRSLNQAPSTFPPAGVR